MMNGVSTTTLAVCALLVACGGGSTDGPLETSSAAASSDYFLKLGGVEGESKSGASGAMLEWVAAEDGTASGVLALACEQSACKTTVVSARLQSALQAYEPAHASVWSIEGFDAETGAPWTSQLVTRSSGSDAAKLWIGNVDPSKIAGVSGGWSLLARAALTTCAPPPGCDAAALPAGWSCVPLCSYDGGKLP